MSESAEHPDRHSDDAAPDPLDYESTSVPALPHTANPRDDELDAARIRQLAALRRGAYRARSYAIIGTVAAAVVAVQLVWMTVTYVHARGWGAYPIGYLQAACLLALLAIYFARRALMVHREIRTPPRLPPEPPGGPDFSTLSDGSQQWKNLEDIR